MPRSDPETWVVGSHVFVYYNVIGSHGYELDRCGSSLPGANLSGTWWVSAQPGWGIHLTDQGDRLFATWYTYDAESRPAWFTIEATRSGDGAYSGPVYRFTGVPYTQISGPAILGSAIAGTARLLPLPNGTLWFDSTVAGYRQERAVERFAFGQLPTCRKQLSTTAPVGNHTGIWWTPAEAGWGLSMSEQGSSIFAAWFTYDEDGEARWFSALLERAADGRQLGPLNQPTSGAPYFTIAGPATVFPVPVVGEAELDLAASVPSFRYRIGNKSVTKAIAPFEFAEPLTRCD